MHNAAREPSGVPDRAGGLTGICVCRRVSEADPPFLVENPGYKLSFKLIWPL